MRETTQLPDTEKIANDAKEISISTHASKPVLAGILQERCVCVPVKRRNSVIPISSNGIVG
jgi:hypothetical protein